MQVGDLVIATEDTYRFDEGDIGLLVHIDRGQPDKEYRPLYYVQWNDRSHCDPYEHSVNGKRIITLYST
jgi:hypothetical protein